MNLTMLDKLSTAGLLEMQARIAEIMTARMDTRLQAGREATFIGRDMLTHTVRVDKINRTTAHCTELGGGHDGKKWRVGCSMLKVKPVERATALQVAKLAAPVVPYRPASAAGDSW